MDRKGRRRIAWTGVILASVLALGWWIVAITGEHPDYVRAARELGAARAGAERHFGPLTWEEYREQEGIEFKSEIAAWDAVATAIPPLILAERRTRTLTRAEVFRAERDWFLGATPQFEGLGFQLELGYDGSDWDLSSFARMREVAGCLAIGLVGAADEGDTAAVQTIGRGLNLLVTAPLQEPTLLGMLVSSSIRTSVVSSVLRGAIRNRSNGQVVHALQTVLDELPPLPDPHAVMSGDARSSALYLDLLRRCPTGELNRFLDTWGMGDWHTEDTGVIYAVYKRWNDVIGKETKAPLRRVGENTKAALEARYWQAQLLVDDAFERAARGDLSAYRALDRFWEERESEKDRSYEFAYTATSHDFIDSYVRMQFFLAAANTAMEILRRFPDRASLPAVLPVDMVVDDPYWEGDAVYRLTDRGFVIYVRGKDGVDDGFVPDVPEMLWREGRMTRSVDAKDWGLVVSYVPNPDYD